MHEFTFLITTWNESSPDENEVEITSKIVSNLSQYKEKLLSQWFKLIMGVYLMSLCEYCTFSIEAKKKTAMLLFFNLPTSWKHMSTNSGNEKLKAGD